VRLIQAGENVDHPVSLTCTLGVGQRDHLAFARFADQQHAPRGEGQHASAVDIVGEDCDVKTVGQLDLLQIEGSLFGVRDQSQENRQEETQRST